ncbi:hypothetical protein PR048_004861 [Dryococelus australis]|uniref:Uncharacterized protein n=1 Tax=Dryococelus australis TaxID=614101 RepID=A0ABQ9I7H6_9NEOP|nr:hypothetical protein PR048_004861 [Dryococelus australis]
MANKETIVAAGEKFLLDLYSVKITLTINEYHYFHYNNLLGYKFNLASLPPTSTAAKQHFFRVYLQVQQLKGNVLEATNWARAKCNN